jgi:hypothetical protein
MTILDLKIFLANSHKQKYRITKWNTICWPEDQGGHGI